MTNPTTTGLTAAVLTVDGELTVTELPRAVTARVAALHAHIGCTTFDVVAVADDLDMWLDDEGLLTNRRPNLLASQLVLQITGRLQRWVGDVVFTGGVDPEGDSTPLSQARLDEIRELVAG